MNKGGYWETRPNWDLKWYKSNYLMFLPSIIISPESTS